MNNLCADTLYPGRLATVEVKVGHLGLGGDFLIRLQTMTTTNTMDTNGTVDQVIRCADAGAELVRITAPGIREAENLSGIRSHLHRNGCFVPLVADIHFTPNAAELAARIVEKVRINPGNYADKKKFETLVYDHDSYRYELDRVRDRFMPLVRICKEYGTALRIGVNHGSLSDRIVSRYGDSPVGMVESAMEFLRVAEDLRFYNIVLSMKSSNPLVMIQAYHLLVSNMQQQLGHCYPLHLGVTEAGDGQQGRIKSAIGIGSLLEDSIGDTIRVSLTEEPELELPVCRSFVDRYTLAGKATVTEENDDSNHRPGFDRVSPDRVRTSKVQKIGGTALPVVIADLSRAENIGPDALGDVGYFYDQASDKWNIGNAAADYIFVGQPLAFAAPPVLGVIVPAQVWQNAPDQSQYYPLFGPDEYPSSAMVSDQMNLVLVPAREAVSLAGKLGPAQRRTTVLVIAADETATSRDCLRLIRSLEKTSPQVPFIFQCYPDNRSTDELVIAYTAFAGRIILSGWKDGIWLIPPVGGEGPAALNGIAFGVLQAARARVSGTEYISCPSCGRTLFDLQTTTEKVRAATNHLKGLKIAVMGCIVNGPGEMADADFGYVGSGPGKISLYKGKDIIRRNVPDKEAVDTLIGLIKQSDRWTDPP